ncbi:MAG: Ig-like domain-containing protein [Candidatus Thiodiazotropha sp.]
MRRRRSHNHSTALVCEELEPRLLLSADLVGIAVDLTPNDAEQGVEKADIQAIEAALQVGSPSQVGEHDSSTAELVIIDPATPDYQSLVDDLISQNGNGRSFEIVLLDTAGNGIEQINDILNAYQGLDAVHILSHGSDGGVQLGDAYLNLDSLSANAGAIESWRDAFSEAGDLLIYGCDLAASEDGRSLVEALARLTGADVAASDDLTGHEDLGGDWDLEHAVGVIETDVAVSDAGQRNWSGILATDIDFTHTDDPVHHWTLDGNAADSIGSADGTVTGTTTVTGQNGDALRFDEVGDYVTIPDVTMSNDFTVTFQFKVDDNTGSLFQYIYSHGDINTTNSLNIFINEATHGSDPNVLRTVIRDADDTLENTALEFDISSIIGDGEWHTYTLTVETGVGSTVYLDGVQKNADTRGGGSFNPSGNVYLGARYDLDANRMFGGDLDEVKIYDHVYLPTGVGTGLSAGTVIATDPVGGTVTYSLVDDAGGMFSIDSDSGELFWTGAPDTSTTQSYDITVRVTDSGAPAYDEVITITTGTGGSDSITGTSHDDLIYGLGESGVSLGTTNYVTNGSFESGGSPDTTGWSVIAGTSLQTKVSGTNGVVSTDGSYYLDSEAPDGNNTFEQTISGLTNGNDYQISFDAADALAGASNSLQIYFGGVLLDTLDPNTTTMQSFSYNVTAGSGDGTNELRFVEAGGIDGPGTAIDNVRMYEVLSSGGDTIDGGAGDDMLIGDGVGGNGTTSQSLTINDAGFEDTALPDGGFGPLSAAWTDDFGYNEVFIGDPSTLDFSSGAPAEGENTLLMVEDNRVSQTLASNFDSSKDYELSLQLGNPLSSGDGNTYSIELYAGGTLIGSATGTEPAADTWTGINISVDGDAYAAADGTALRIVLANTSPNFTGDYFAVDDIQLNEITSSVVAAGDDSLTGGVGDDYLDGGAGTDTAVFSGARADYTIDYFAATGELVVSDTRGGSPDGTDTLINVETLQFSDQAVVITDPSAQFNDAPVLDSASLTVDEGQIVTLSVANFGVTDPDDTAFTYTISGVTGGYFQLSTNPGVSITSFSSANLTGGSVQFVDNGDETAPAFSMTVNDGEADSNTQAAMVNYTAVNDDPVVVNLDGDVHNYTEGDGTVLIEQSGDAVVSDVDSTNFNGGSLTVEVDSGLQASEDVFSIRNEGTNAGQIGVSGSDVTYGGTVIGTFSGGTGLDPLTVNLNTNATPTAITFLVRNITYENSNIDNPTSGSRSVVIDITDGDGGACLTQNLTLNVSSVNDAPMVDTNGADGVGVDFAVTFTEDGGAVNVVDTDATISDVDNTTYQNLSINLLSFLDGASEQITIAGYVFTYGTSENQIRTVGGTDFEIDFDGTGFNVMLDGGGGMPEADLQSLLRGVTYENTSQDPTAGDRTINFFAQDSSLLNGPIATSTITVNPQNDAPTATDNANSVSESGFVSGNVITDDSGSGVDSDPEGDGLQVTQVVGGAYTPGLPVTLVSGAQVTFQSNGSYTYNTNGQFDGLGAGSVMLDIFTYQISDGNGGFDSATVTITINGSNNTPAITSAGLTLDEGQTVTLGDANFAVTDADDTDFTYTVSSISGGYFQLSTNPGVSITSFTSANLTGGLVQFVDDGNEVAPAFSVTVNDGEIDSNTLAATINFTLVSDSTPVANIDSITVAEGGTVTTLDGGFSTVLNNDTGLVDIPVTVSLVSGVANGSLTLNGDGTFSYTHDGSENFTDSFIYRVTDNDGQSADATVTINVTPVSNATPVANADSITVAEGGTVTTLVGGSSTVLNNDTGLGDTPVTVSLVTDVTNGSLTLNGDGTFSYAHDGSENFTDSFIYRVTDNDGETADATVTINVTPVSDQTPVANVDSITLAEGGTTTTLDGGLSTVLNNDTGLGDTPVTVSLVTDVTNGSLTLNGDGTFSYTHDGSENFTDSFTYRVTDNDGETADATVTINITPVSDETPVANADSITVAEGGTITTLVGGSSTVLNNDTGLGDTPVTVSLVTDVTNGSLTLNGDGTFSYTHDGSENFTDSFTYRVTDNDGETADATVTINVTPVSDQTPVANADSITLAEGGTVTTLVGGSSTVLNNDTGLGDTPVTVSLVTDVTNGSLTLNSDGTFSYTHDGSENFTDSFTYRVTDNDGETADATVTINITPVSDETPVANADSITVAEGGTITTLVGGSSTILNNDTGLGDTPVTVSLVTDVTNGSLTLNGDGTFSYTHDGSENFTDSFTYRVTDNDGETADATVTINITPISDQTPVANADSISVAEGGTVTTLVGGSSTVLNNDTGLGDTPVTVSLVTDVVNGVLILNSDGTFSYTHDGSENFTDSFTYRVTDNDGETADATVMINVTPVSDATPVANADSISVAEGGTATTLDGGFTTVLNNDIGLGDTPVTVSLVTDVTNGSLTLNGDGTFSYTHDGSENFTDSFIYRVTDNDGETADATVTINITPVSDQTPVANADSITLAEGGTVTTLVGGSSTVLNNDTGLGDTPVTVSLVTDVTNGSLTLNSDGTFSYTHDGSENFTDSFTYRVTDNDGETADATVTINITPVSDETPVANADSITVAEGGTITTLVGGSSTVLNNDTGLGDTPVTVSLVADVTYGTLTLNGDGTFSYTHDGSGIFSDSFTYRITDNDGQTSDTTVTINVISNNNPPEASDINFSVLEDNVYTGNLPAAVDDDGDTVTYRLESNPVHGSITLEADGGFSYTPDADYHGADSFIYSVSDGNGGNNSYLVEIDVVSVNDSPVITSHGENENVLLSLEENATLVTMVTADDPENDALSFTIDGGADLGLFSIDPMSGELVFSHAPDMENPLDADQDNLYQVQVLVSDGNGGTDRQSFTIEVTDVDEFDVGLLMDVEDAPDAISLSDSFDDGVGITVWAEDPDSSQNRITYSLDDDSNGLFAIDPASGTITLASTVENRDASQFEITVRATSEDGSYSLHTFHIAINRVIDTAPEPEQPYLDDIILDLNPEEPVESQATTDKAGPSQQPPTVVDAVSEELSSEDQEASLSTGTEERTRVVIDDIERPAIERLSPSLFSEDSLNSYRYDYYQARLTPVAVAPKELPAFDTSIGELIEVPEAIWQLLDSMNSEMSEHQREEVSSDKITVQNATFGTLALSAGYVAWLLRAGVLSASLLSFTPLWRQIDPLPVLSAHAKRRDEDQDHPPEEDPEEKRLAKLFDRKKKHGKNRSVFFMKDR